MNENNKSTISDACTFLNYRLLLCGIAFITVCICSVARVSAASLYSKLTYRYDHYLFEVNPNDYPAWYGTQEVWTYNGVEISPPQALRIDGDNLPSLPTGFVRSVRTVLDSDAIEATLLLHIAPTLNRPSGEVKILRNGETITFEGVGLTGREVDTRRAALLTIDALQNGIIDIQLPVIEQQPVLHVEDAALRAMGISEVVTIGESNFAHSTINRRHNIATGLEKFNGHLIPQGSVFSFNETLGPVNASTGYRKELVILGEKTLPDYGGGLCQVSTTAYRGIWEYGFPIVARKNHSFAVGYYAPQGTDATIYPPNVDMKFQNNSSGALLMQTYAEGDTAYFIYYGTKDARQTEIVGPYIWDRRSPPADRTEYTNEIPEGTRRSVGKATPGMQAAWFRIAIETDGSETIEPVYSFYEARPNFIQIGGVQSIPSWIGGEAL